MAQGDVPWEGPVYEIQIDLPDSVGRLRVVRSGVRVGPSLFLRSAPPGAGGFT